MDQVKIGKFIAECRKKKNLTQLKLSEKLNISDRAISKWETGKGMPDSSIMLQLCEILEKKNYTLAREKSLTFNKNDVKQLVSLLESDIDLINIINAYRLTTYFDEPEDVIEKESKSKELQSKK